MAEELALHIPVAERNPVQIPLSNDFGADVLTMMSSGSTDLVRSPVQWHSDLQALKLALMAFGALSWQ
jgi:hypothetical protein